VNARLFGRLPDGRDVHEIEIGDDRIAAHIINYGAILRDLNVGVGNKPRSVVLGFDTLDAYVNQGAYIGAIAGRYANRIKGGRFSLEGKACQLSLNESGRTHLHGGHLGFDRKLWEFSAISKNTATLSLHSKSGEEGYPGALDVVCTYRIDGPDRLTIELTATCDAATIVNLTGHSYFNLGSGGDIRNHRLMIPAEEYLPVSGELIPESGAAPVAGTEYDFRVSRPIGGKIPYDNTWIVDWRRNSEPRLMARLASGNGDLTMELSSTEPGLQFYAGAFLDAKPFGAYGGLCLEPQCFPDSPNHPEFPTCVLRPGESYRHVIEHRFISS
jgi:aldose 1-epimerase